MAEPKQPAQPTNTRTDDIEFTFTNVEVTDQTLDAALPAVRDAVTAASFIAFDCEFSGMGQDRTIVDTNVQTRYGTLRKVASSHGLFQFGLSTFTKSESESGVEYHVSTFTFLLAPQDDYVVTPRSMAFLASHGMDFARVFSQGIRFKSRGNTLHSPKLRFTDKDEALIQSSSEKLSQLWQHVGAQSAPLIVHNGILDICFIYNCFVGPLPTEISALQSQLHDAFRGGLFDTKFIGELFFNERSSFLEYLLKKAQQRNLRRVESGKPCFRISASPSPNLNLPVISYCMPKPVVEDTAVASGAPVQICSEFSMKGHCSLGASCTKSHSTDQLIQSESRTKSSENSKSEGSANGSISIGSKRPFSSLDTTGDAPVESPAKRQKLNGSETTSADVPANGPPPSSVLHSAGFDAFATGYIFASYRQSKEFCEEKVRQRLYLIGKDQPLLVYKSKYG